MCYDAITFYLGISLEEQHMDIWLFLCIKTHSFFIKIIFMSIFLLFRIIRNNNESNACILKHVYRHSIGENSLLVDFISPWLKKKKNKSSWALCCLLYRCMGTWFTILLKISWFNLKWHKDLKKIDINLKCKKKKNPSSKSIKIFHLYY